MNRPPKATPSSDIDGVHQDERRNTDVAAEQGQSAADLKRAGEESVARPDQSDNKPTRDDRTH